MQSKAKTVAAYLAELPADRRAALETVRKVILKNLDTKGGFEEGMQYGGIGYFVPHRVFPAGYHCDPTKPLCFAGLASQKNHMAVYLMCIYGSTDQDRLFREEWAKTGKKLDMGKSCVRFKKVEDLALDVIGRAIKRVTVKKYLEYYSTALEQMGKGTNKPKSKSAAKKKTSKKKVSNAR